MAEERGRAAVELLAAIPLLLVAGAIALQLLLTGYALTLADGAAEAGALALAAGGPPGGRGGSARARGGATREERGRGLFAFLGRRQGRGRGEWGRGDGAAGTAVTAHG